MEDPNNQYSMADLRQLINGARSPHFPPVSPPQELFSGHRNYEMMMVGRQVGMGFHELCADSAANADVANNLSSCGPSIGATDGEIGPSAGGDGGTGRWPRQETLTLLEIRSRLDSKFKEANQKGPLWDEVSRIMSEEYGYQRSGKKCREKFENLYKYYKKTKEGKAGRQDGKHYRFFRQLEALYGDSSNNNVPAPIPETQYTWNSLRFQNASASNTSTQPNHSLSLSNASGSDTSSSDDNDLSIADVKENESSDKRRKRRGSKNWKAKIKEFIDSQMRKLMEKQEAWLEKIMKTLEQKEQERMRREEEWRKEDAARLEREHRFWAKEREWIQSRDAALMEALQKLSGRELKSPTSSKERNKKRKENSRSCSYIQNDSSLYNQCVYGEIGEQVVDKVRAQTNGNHGSSPSSSNAGNANAMPDSCLRFLMGEGENFWENYGLKLNQGENQ